MNRKLFRCSSDAMIAGVCSGLGKYLEIDPAFIRVFFVLLTLADGIGALIYVLLWILIPREDCKPNTSISQTTNDATQEIATQARIMGDELRQSVSPPHPQIVAYIGIGLIAIGIVALLRNLNPAWFSWLNSGLLWAILFIVGGIFLLLRSRKL